MSLDIYLRRDIANILRSLAVAGGDPSSKLDNIPIRDLGTASRDVLEDIYRAGFQHALVAVGVAVGLNERNETPLQ